MVIQLASMPRYYYYQNISYFRYVRVSPFFPSLLHRPDKFLLKKEKNGCLETQCFSSDLALWLTLKIVYLCLCV